MSVMTGVCFWGCLLCPKTSLPVSSMGSISLDVSIHGAMGRFPSLTLQNVDFYLILFLSSSESRTCWFNISGELTSCFLTKQARNTWWWGTGKDLFLMWTVNKFFAFCSTCSFHLYKYQGPSVPDPSKVL